MGSVVVFNYEQLELAVFLMCRQSNEKVPAISFVSNKRAIETSFAYMMYV